MPVYAAESEAINIPTNYEVVDEMGLGFNLGKTFSASIESRQNLGDIKRELIRLIMKVLILYVFLFSLQI